MRPGQSNEGRFAVIEFSVENGVGEILLNAPHKLNSLNESDLEQFASVLSAAEAAVAGGQIRALFLSGKGRAFCAGRDISEVDGANDDAAAYLEGKLLPLLKQLQAFPVPTFAAAQGACLGVGLGLLIACDVVYVAESAKFGSPFANLGATLDSGGHWFFVQRLGAQRTLDLIYTAELMSGAEAVAAGLFSRAKPAEELIDFTRAAAVKAATGPSQAFAASKKLVAQIVAGPLGLWESVEKENSAQIALSQTNDYAEGFAAFREKRRPLFTGE